MPMPRPMSLPVRALVAAAALCGASPSHAAIYTGNWDPLYGFPFADLGWSAQALVDVPASCLAQPDGTYETGPCGGLAFLGANVSFYDAADVSRTPLETFAIANVQTVSGGVTVVDHQVAGISSDGFFDEFVPGSAGPAASIDGAGAYSFSLVMQTGGFAQLYYGPPSGLAGCDVDASCGPSNQAALGVFAPVPEPATAALLLGGLAVVTLASRRRSTRGAVG